MVALLYDRRSEVEIDSAVFEDLRVTFNITKSVLFIPNKARIVIYGLAEDRLQQVLATRSLGVRVRLRVGYRDTGLTQIFFGDLRKAERVFSGGDSGLALSADDGLRFMRRRYAPRSFNRTARLNDILREVLRDADIGLGNLNAVEDRFREVQIGGAYAYGPDVVTTLQDLTQRAGFEWSIQDNQIVFRDAQIARRSTLVVLNAGTGLIGTPELSSDGILSARSLLQPDLQPGVRVEITSALVNGRFSVRQITYQGDTHGNAWYANIDGRAPGALDSI